ncbi:MAG: sigma-54 dependent transcriptional regulator [Gammaproteobacteria bacterium]
MLVVDDEHGIRSFLQRYLKKTSALVETAENIEEAERLRARCHFDLMILDIRLSGAESGVEWLNRLREQGENTDVIFMTAHADLETAIDALRAGAADFILKPFRIEQMRAAVDRCIARRKLTRENFVLRRQISQFYDLDGVIGDCEVIKELCGLIKRVAPMPSTVLISGESGTGKELAARSIHILSGREGPFVPLNCGAISSELLESELFGHAKGAFTGAHQAREGLCNFAHNGTLFLDEIGEMPLAMQTKLLRFLEDRMVRPVGMNRELPVDVRVIAASNRDLSEEVAAGRFREDLFYRLNILNMRIPPLRERLEDIPVLARHFSALLSKELGMPPVVLDDDELQRLQHYSWPGNVRELRNVIERSLLLGKRPSEGLNQVQTARSEEETGPGQPRGGEELSLAELEQRHILATLDATGGNKSEAARRLGVSRKTLERKLKSWAGEEGEEE